MNFDFVLPVFAPMLNHGSHVHFSSLARSLQRLGHGVAVHTTAASGVPRMEKEGASWTADMRRGPSPGAYPLRRYRVPPEPPAGRARNADGETDLAQAGKLEAAAPSIRDGIPHTREDALRLLARIEAATGSLPRDLHLARLRRLGPQLPARAIVARAKRRRAALVIGYFPFQVCHDIAVEAVRQRVPYFVCPLFHPLEPLHHNPLLFEACRAANAVFCLNPFAVGYFEKTLACRRAFFMGSAPVEVSVSPAPPAPANSATFVFIGRLDPGKNLSEAIEIVRRTREHGMPAARLVLLSQLRPVAQRSLPAFVDYVPSPTAWEIAHILRGARALLFPSLLESLGQVVVEAWRAGAPALVKASNLCTASVLEHAGLHDWVYSSVEEAVEKAVGLDPQGLSRVDAAWFSWEAIGARMAAAAKDSL